MACGNARLAWSQTTSAGARPRSSNTTKGAGSSRPSGGAVTGILGGVASMGRKVYTEAPPNLWATFPAAAREATGPAGAPRGDARHNSYIHYGHNIRLRPSVRVEGCPVPWPCTRY